MAFIARWVWDGKVGNQVAKGFCDATTHNISVPYRMSDGYGPLLFMAPAFAFNVGQHLKVGNCRGRCQS
jgi:hypothetical protein